MRNRRLSEKITALLLTVMMSLNCGSNVVRAYAGEQPEAEVKEHMERPGMGYIDMGYTAPKVGEVSHNDMKVFANSAIPAEYDSRDYGYLTSVKNQGSLGTCWSFAAVASMEAYAVSHGLVDSADDIDLSEYALASLTFDDRSFVDDTGTTEGDVTTTTNMYDNMKNGANDQYVFKTLTKWAGVMNEEDAMYDMSGNTIVQYDKSKISYILTNQYFINMTDTDHVKRAVMENGAVSTYYNANVEYSITPEDKPWLTEYYHYTYEDTYSNHAIAIVGWDDNMPKENFTIEAGGNTYTPTENGAWLIKNSWGTYYGDEGYMWISYEDKTLIEASACVYQIAPSDTYMRNYQHDGSNIFSYNIRWSGISEYANVFDVAGNAEQIIKAVAFAVEDANRAYSVQIYLNPQTDKPKSGTPLLDEELTGNIVYAGYYTIPLPEPVTVNSGDTFSVVVSFDRDTSVSAAVNGNFAVGGRSSCIAVNTCGANQSYLISGNAVADTYDYGSDDKAQVNFCIKAFTDEVGENITPSRIISIESEALDTLKIAWQKVAGVTEYELLRATAQNGPYTVVYSGSGLSYSDASVEPGKDYFYKVRINNNGENLDSSVERGILKLPNATISSISSDNTGITIAWNGIALVDGYTIYRSEDGVNYNEIANVTNGNTYKDVNVKYNKTYYYMIKTYHVKNGTTYKSDGGNAISGKKEVGTPTGFSVISTDVGKVNFSWDNISYAKGYTLYRSFTYANGTKITEQKVADIAAGVNSCTANVSDLEEGGTVIFYLKAYDIENGVRVYGKNTSVSVFIKFKPVENIRWYVNEGYLYAIWDEYECNTMTVTGYSLWGYNVKTGGSITSARDTSAEKIILPSYNPSNEYYITVQARNAMNTIFTHLQNPRVKIGGAYKPIKLNTINDVKCDKGNKILLQATLTDVMENFDYSYQWYETSSRTGQGTKISGATGSTYSPDTSSYGKKYYYCVVSGIYNGTKTGSTNVVLVQTDRDMSECVVSSISNQLYTGKNITPSVSVTYKGMKLTAGTDYTVAYSNNINAGTATVTITGKGAYSGTVSRNFVIYKDIPDKITSQSVSVNQSSSIISKITVGTKVSDILNKIDQKKYVAVYNGNTRVSSDTLVATGMKVVISDGNNIKKQYTIIVTGDVNGDGKINVADMMSVKSHILKKSTLAGNWYSAADANGDSKINVADFMSIKGYILKKNTIPGIAVK